MGSKQAARKVVFCCDLKEMKEKQDEKNEKYSDDEEDDEEDSDGKDAIANETDLYGSPESAAERQSKINKNWTQRCLDYAKKQATLFDACGTTKLYGQVIFPLSSSHSRRYPCIEDGQADFL